MFPVGAVHRAVQPQPARRPAGAVVPDGSDAEGDVVRHEMHDGVIRSTARMTYTAVNAILAEGDPDAIAQYRELVPTFELMHELFRSSTAAATPRLGRLRPARGASGARRRGFIEDIVASERNVAHRLIEEFMLLANETVAAPSRGRRGCRRCTASTSRRTR